MNHPSRRTRSATVLWCALMMAVGVQGTSAQTPPPLAATPDQPPPIPAGDLGFRFKGYLRSGFGVDATGKGQQPFIAPLANAKYRLGNEAETYLETTFAYGARSEEPDPAYFETKITLAYVTPTSQSSSFATTFSLREAYALARRVWAAQPTATFWAGADGTPFDPRTVAAFDPTGAAVYPRWLALAAGLVLVFAASAEITDETAGEYLGCVLVVLAGASLVGRANDLVSLFLALELVSIPTYVLFYLPFRTQPAQEAARMYLNVVQEHRFVLTAVKSK